MGALGRPQGSAEAFAESVELRNVVGGVIRAQACRVSCWKAARLRGRRRARSPPGSSPSADHAALGALRKGPIATVEAVGDV